MIIIILKYVTVLFLSVSYDNEKNWQWEFKIIKMTFLVGTMNCLTSNDGYQN